jgi:pimeloyl-ACP methyl ester carboxylesterase/DNA-binding CsgD family transcriptional regulator
VIDALLGYAVDPVRWESFAAELEAHRSELAELEPGALLAALSQAESLAWQLKGQPEINMQRAGCTYFLLDCNGGVLASSHSAADVADYCWVDDGRLRFSSKTSAHNFSSGMRVLQDDGHHEVLVELHGARPSVRYGYLVHAQDLPAALNLQNSEICCGLLIAHADSAQQTKGILQSSFGLTAAELALCEHLSAGLQLKEAAQQLDISTNTARNHLQSIFEKTHVNRQNDLLLMLTQLSVILSVISAHGEDGAKSIDAAAYPAHRFVITTAAGEPRRIAYRQYGNGPRHVVFFHESAGTSRLLPGTHELAAQLGLTITAVERPGTGFSDELRQYDFNATARDVESVLNELGIKEVSLLGYLSGSAHALATAALLGRRAVHVMLVAGRGTRGLSYAQSGTLASLRRQLTKQPWLLSTFFNILRSRASRDTNRRLLLRVYGSVDHDRTFLDAHPDVLDHLVDASLEAMTITGAGIAGEIRCFTDPAYVDLTGITAPVTAWHGEADNVAEFESLRQELAGVSFEHRLFPDHGSLILYEYWNEILQYLAEENTPLKV